MTTDRPAAPDLGGAAVVLDRPVGDLVAQLGDVHVSAAVTWERPDGTFRSLRLSTDHDPEEDHDDEDDLGDYYGDET